MPKQISEQRKAVPAHTRRVPQSDMAGDTDESKFFDESRVPVQTVTVPNPETAGLAADQFEVIGEKITYRLAQRTIGLLEPIYEAQLESIRASRVKAMDETPIKAGRSGHGKMKQAYFWPVYGEREEICFAYFPSRAAWHVRAALGLRHAQDGVLLSDGYACDPQ